MSRFKTWQKAGLSLAGLHAALSIFLSALALGGWWYQETFWYRILLLIDYVPAELHRAFLSVVELPRIYDAPLTWRDRIVISSSGWILGLTWWFLLGALGSTACVWLARQVRRRRAR